MEKKIAKISLFSLVFFSFLVSNSFAQPSVCDWRGYASVNITSTFLANTSYVVTSYTNGGQATDGTIYSTGYYIAHVPGSSGDNITLQICGVNVTQSFQTWSCASPGYNTLNISINTSADGSSCTYACGCTGGYCNSGICASSAPTTTTTTSVVYTGGGGGGVYSGTTTTSTTSAAPPVTETKTIVNGTAGSTVQLNITNSNQLKISEIDITFNDSVTNANIQVTESSAPGSNFAISSAIGAVYKYLQITKTNINDSDISSVKIKFKVEKSWLTANGIDPNTIKLKRLVGSTWIDLPTVKTGEDATYIYFEATSPGFSLFAITGQKIVTTTTSTTSSSTTSSTTFTIPISLGSPAMWLAVFLVLIVVVVVIIGLKQKTIMKKVMPTEFLPLIS